MKLLFLLLLFSLNILAQKTDSLGNKQNVLCGIEYYDHKEVASFKDYINIGGTIVGEKNKSGDYQFTVSQLSKGKQKIIVFEQIISYKKNEDGSSSPKFRILDTVNIIINKNEYLNLFECRQNSLKNSCLIAIVIDEIGEKYHDQIIKAWLLNTETGKIIELKNTKGIDCYNDSFEPIEQEPILQEDIK